VRRYRPDQVGAALVFYARAQKDVGLLLLAEEYFGLQEARSRCARDLRDLRGQAIALSMYPAIRPELLRVARHLRNHLHVARLADHSLDEINARLAVAT
jgi:hypothetical protein